VSKRVETLATNEKILKALKSAAEYLDNSIVSLSRKEEGEFADNLWHVAAELEYATFLFSIQLGDESDLSRWRPKPEPGKMEAAPVLMKVQDLIKEAEGHLQNRRLREAYQGAYVARHYALGVQEDFAKKKREALRKK
jgi:hypothetical protein